MWNIFLNLTWFAPKRHIQNSKFILFEILSVPNVCQYCKAGKWVQIMVWFFCSKFFRPISNLTLNSFFIDCFKQKIQVRELRYTFHAVLWTTSLKRKYMLIWRKSGITLIPREILFLKTTQGSIKIRKLYFFLSPA